MKGISRARWPWLFLIAILVGGLTVAAIGDSGPRTPAERARALNSSIRCPTCQGQSVADSTASVAKGIRAEVARRIENGDTDDEIRDYIVNSFPNGDDLLLTPPKTGVAGLIWFLPVTVFVLALGGLVAAFRHWRSPPDIEVSDDDRALVASAQATRHGES